MISRPVAIIIPTYNNRKQLVDCVSSIINNRSAEDLFHIYIVNNGHASSCDGLEHENITVIQAGDNLGWEGGIELGLQNSKEPFVVFMNDDTLVPTSSKLWLNKMLYHFKDPRVAAVGPSSNVVMGHQNIWSQTPLETFDVKFLIFFCVMVRRSAIEAVGGVDTSLPGGDDLDMSIRLRDAGFRAVADKNVFIYHIGFQTGTRVYGDHTKEGGWNSYRFKEKTDFALIRKHGFRKWWEVMRFASEPLKIGVVEDAWEDKEGKLIKDLIKESDEVLELGVGGKKTVERALGVDIVKSGDTIATLTGDVTSVADVQADVSEPLPFKEKKFDVVVARHVLEHLVDTVYVLKNWREVLKVGGRIVIAVPNEDKIRSIPINIEHVHAFNEESLTKIVELCGFKVLETKDPGNKVSFVLVAEAI